MIAIKILSGIVAWFAFAIGVQWATLGHGIAGIFEYRARIKAVQRRRRYLNEQRRKQLVGAYR